MIIDNSVVDNQGDERRAPMVPGPGAAGTGGLGDWGIPFEFFLERPVQSIEQPADRPEMSVNFVEGPLGQIFQSRGDLDTRLEFARKQTQAGA
jgi:hypothetical protein